jgi:hypothetical protein
MWRVFHDMFAAALYSYTYHDRMGAGTEVDVNRDPIQPSEEPVQHGRLLPGGR